MVGLARLTGLAKSRSKKSRACSPKNSRAARRMFEGLEERQLMSLLGIAVDVPITTLLNGDAGSLMYTANTQTFDDSATPIRFITSTGSVPIVNNKDFQLHIKVDPSGTPSSNGTALADLTLTGDVSLNNNNVYDYSGVLLTGTITQMGSEADGAVSLFDFRFTPTGGALVAPYFTGKDIGLFLTSEQSTFTGMFNADFTGATKGVLGVIDQVTQTPANISGLVFGDCNNDGVFQTGEKPIGGATVTLNGVDSFLHPVTLTTQTASDGSYSFAVQPGTYSVTETVPTGWTLGKDSAGPAGGVASPGTITGITVTPGQSAINNEFGNTMPSSLAGQVYVDANNDGVIQSGETLLGGVKITLTGTDAFNNAVNLTAQTDSNGAYTFSGLIAGNYTITETPPATYIDGKVSIGTTGGTIVGRSVQNITLDFCGNTGTGYNFGEQKFTCISGTKFKDITGNGFSADDTGLAGVTIQLYKDVNNNGVLDCADGGPIACVVTDVNGHYSFCNLQLGRYFVKEVVPCGWIQTGPTCIAYYTDNANKAGLTFTGNDFDDYQMNCCCGRLSCVSYIINGCNVVCDLTGNTHQGDQVEVKFTVGCGAPITLSLVAYTAPENYFNADDAGQQQIFDLATGTFGPGCYTLKVQLPECNYQIDFVCGQAIDHFGPACSNIFYHAQCRFIDGDNGGCNPVFAGMSNLSGFVYNDVDNDGVKDTGEAGIGGVTIKLVGTDNQGHSVTLIRTTNADGSYAFKGLRAGTYKVLEYTPGGWIDGKDTAGSLGGTAGNDVISGIAVGTSVSGVNYNFGETKGCSIAGNVYCDRNNSGKYDCRDSGISCVKITLTGKDDQGNCVTLTTTTDCNGNYCFSGLRCGTYSISECQPSGYSNGSNNCGSDGGKSGSNCFSGITLKSGDCATDYNFGELQNYCGWGW